MMKKKIIRILLAALPLLPGCVKNILDGAAPGTQINFAASTSYDNNPGTKTEYSGVFTNETVSGVTHKYERINWVSGDKIHIYSPQAAQQGNAGVHEADYDIQASTISNSGRNSSARISSTSNTGGLVWGEGSGNYNFYALYPSPAIQTGVSMNGSTVTAPIPQYQRMVGTAPREVNDPTTTSGKRLVYDPDMNYAYMYAAAAASNGGTVDLRFRPLMTAFEITLGTKDPNGMEIREIYLSSNHPSDPSLSGTVNATINADNTFTLNDVTGGSSTIYAYLPEFVTGNTVTVQYGRPITFTLFALPKDLTNMAIKIRLANGTTRDYEFRQTSVTGPSVVFPACRKVRITNLNAPQGETWTYTIDNIDDVITYGHNPVSGLDFTVNSYKYSNLNPTHTPVSWTARVTSVTNAVAGDLSAQTWSGDGNGNMKTVNIVNPSSNQYPDDPGADASAAAAAKLASNPYRGSDAAPWDLSTHKFYGSETDLTTTIARETANCYVVSSPGVYKFPLVYGNAITNGSTNSVAFNPGGSSTNRLTTFQNYAGNSISSPYILADIGASVANMNAAVVWQDVPVDKIILRNGNYGVVGSSASDAYIWFKIEPDDIKQGNIVLALRRGTTIVWSWHIWITEKIDESDYVIPVESPNTTNLKMMKYNLGWTDASNATGYAYPTRIWNIEVTLDDDHSVTRTFQIRQIGDAKTVPANIGTNTFYQWGRKDPELPARNSLENKQFYSNDGYNPDGGTDGGEYILNRQGPASMVISNTIQNPHIHYYANNNNPQWTNIINLWDADEVNYDNDAFVNKTIYDPCPPGFNVPRRNAFMVFTNKNGTWELGNTARWANGDAVAGLGVNYFSRRNRQGQRVFFPATGARREKSNFQAIFELGYYWSAAMISGGGKARSLQFLASGGDAGYTYAILDQWNSAGYTIRPTTENTISPSSLPQSSRLPAPSAATEQGW